MQSIGFAVPLLPGMAPADRAAMRSCWAGERRDAYRAARERLGITREAVWIQGLPAGDIAVVYLEAEDPAAALGGMATSDEPFDRWFRAHVREVHGIDLGQGLALPEQVLDHRA